MNAGRRRIDELLHRAEVDGGVLLGELQLSGNARGAVAQDQFDVESGAEAHSPRHGASGARLHDARPRRKDAAVVAHEVVDAEAVDGGEGAASPGRVHPAVLVGGHRPEILRPFDVAERQRRSRRGVIERRRVGRVVGEEAAVERGDEEDVAVERVVADVSVRRRAVLAQLEGSRAWLRREP